jgi:tRNA threonylcarbamoyladenosine biosynthesis protein TsaB
MPASTPPAHPPLAVAVETSARQSSVAVVRDGRLLAEESFGHGLRNAAALVSLVDRLIRSTGAVPADVPRLYLSIGPGSFTGIRIAVTFAKMWALARQLTGAGLEVVPVPSLDVIVENLPDSPSPAAVVLDAKRGQIYTASYQPSPAGSVRRWHPTNPPRLDTLGHLLEAQPQLTLTGEGLAYHPLPSPLPPDSHIALAPAELWTPRAAVLARIGPAYPPCPTDAIAQLKPTYIRLPEAEEKYLQQHPSP